jgi:hypothetical protein
MKDSQGDYQPFLQNGALWFLSKKEIEDPNYISSAKNYLYYGNTPIRILRELFLAYVLKPDTLDISTLALFDKHFKQNKLVPSSLSDVQQKLVELNFDEEGDEDEFERGAQEPFLTGYSTIADPVPKSKDKHTSKSRAALVKK